jgi:hypothetical protein
MKSFKTHHLIWALFLIVAVLSLTFSVVSESPPLTNSERVSNLASDFACPVFATGTSDSARDCPAPTGQAKSDAKLLTRSEFVKGGLSETTEKVRDKTATMRNKAQIKWCVLKLFI